MDNLQLSSSELATLPQLDGRVNRNSAHLLSKVWLNDRYHQLEELWRKEAPTNSPSFEEVRRMLGLVGRSSSLLTETVRCGVELVFPIEDGDDNSVVGSAQKSETMPTLLQSLFKRSAQPTLADIETFLDKATRLEAVHRQVIDALTDSGCLSYLFSVPWVLPWEGQDTYPKQAWLDRLLEDHTLSADSMIEAYKNVAYDRASSQLVMKTIAAAREQAPLEWRDRQLLVETLKVRAEEDGSTWLQALMKQTKTVDDFLPIAIDAVKRERDIDKQRARLIHSIALSGSDDQRELERLVHIYFQKPVEGSSGRTWQACLEDETSTTNSFLDFLRARLEDLIAAKYPSDPQSAPLVYPKLKEAEPVRKLLLNHHNFAYVIQMLPLPYRNSRKTWGEKLAEDSTQSTAQTIAQKAQNSKFHVPGYNECHWPQSMCLPLQEEEQHQRDGSCSYRLCMHHCPRVGCYNRDHADAAAMPKTES